MDLFGKQAKKDNEATIGKVQDGLKGLGLNEDQIKDFMSKLTEKPEAAAPNENKANVGKPTDEGAKAPKEASDPLNKVGEEGSAPKGTAPIAPEAKAEAEPEAKNEPPLDYHALYDEERKANEGLAARLAQVEDAVKKIALAGPGFGNEQRIPNGTQDQSSDAQSAADRASQPRHTIPQMKNQ
jgi:hypothetical protein